MSDAKRKWAEHCAEYGLVMVGKWEHFTTADNCIRYMFRFHSKGWRAWDVFKDSTSGLYYPTRLGADMKTPGDVRIASIEVSREVYAFAHRYVVWHVKEEEPHGT